MSKKFQLILNDVWNKGLPKSLLKSAEGKFLLKIIKMPPHLNPNWSGRSINIGKKTLELPFSECEEDLN